MAAGLAHEAAFGFDFAANGLAIGDLRLADRGVHFELAQQAIDDNLQMQLAHPGDQGLPGLRVAVDAEGRIFLGQLVERLAQLVLVGLGLRLDRDRMTGSGNSIDSSTIGWAGSHRVSPVVVSCNPTAAISPANTSEISSRLLACILRSRPIRSRFCLVEL